MANELVEFDELQLFLFSGSTRINGIISRKLKNLYRVNCLHKKIDM